MVKTPQKNGSKHTIRIIKIIKKPGKKKNKFIHTAGEHVFTAEPAKSHLEPGSTGHGVVSEATLKAAASSGVPKLGERTKV